MVFVFICYWAAVFGLLVYGVNCYVLMRSFSRNFKHQVARLQRMRQEFWQRTNESELPSVTVQLPIYNERFVVGRLIHAAAALDYPHEKLEIQVLDDSTDGTCDVVAEHVDYYRKQGLQIEHVRREHREGYKAGALRDGMKVCRGELIAIFDADFVPEPDFLRLTIPFFDDSKVALVQGRWGHINPKFSALTRAQAVAIDGHFSVEQAGRRWGGYYLNFNGTAGVWRRTAIDDAGGWKADTLTEDLDLSYRAQLKKWKVEYAVDVVVPAEIPVDISAFKSQQRRWAKGSIQTAIKLIPSMLRSDESLGVKLQAMIHLTHYLVHPLMLSVALLAVPLLSYWTGDWGPLPFGIMLVGLVVGSTGPSALYVTAQRSLYKDWLHRLLAMPTLMLIGTGIAVSNTRAVLEALLGIKSAFIRTPKRALSGQDTQRKRAGYRLPLGLVFVLEAALAVYCAWGLSLYLQHGKYLIGPFLVLYAAGFAFVALCTLAEAVGRFGPSAPADSVDEQTSVAASLEAYQEVMATYSDRLPNLEPVAPVHTTGSL